MCAALIAGVYNYIFGDSTNGTSVPELVERLENKNTDWLAEIDGIVSGQPTIRDKRGNAISAYTRVNQTYLDSDGNPCMVTDNTKEIISMSAVYFKQDFSDAEDVFKYVDTMWDHTHNLTYSEGSLYGCDGAICLNEDLTFNTDAQGFNGGKRTYSCATNWSNIAYTDCYKIQSEHDYRLNLCKTWSYRFENSVATASKYSGITNLRTKNISMGYGCQTKTETFRCTDIRNIGNSEVLVKLVDKTGIPYSTLYSQKGCQIKHSGLYEGAPRSGCNNYSLIRKYFSFTYTSLPAGDYTFTWNARRTRYEYVDETTHREYSFRTNGQGEGGKYLNMDELDVWYDSESGKFKFVVPYYECNEKTCSGHSITYHFCPGEHEEMVCYGHVNLDVNAEVIAFDKIFDLVVTDLPYVHFGHGGNVNIDNICTHPEDTYTDIVYDESGVRIGFTCVCGMKWTQDGGFDYSDVEDYTPSDPNQAVNRNVWIEDDKEWARNLRNQDWEEMYGVYVPDSLFEGLDGVVSVIMPTHANSLPIPLLNQGDYPNSPYGSYGTVASHGCGITCVAMLDSYYKDQITSPAYLARMFGNYNTAEGSYWSLFADSAEVLMLPYEKQTSSWAEVVQALQDGKPVVSIQNENGIFTSGGHFILLTGITPSGKILVNDPNGANYTKNATMVEGFANGFTQGQIQVGSSGAYWIYGVKPSSDPVQPNP
jgi:hypothetical protein